MEQDVRMHGREAAEFLNQIVDYYDATAMKTRPPTDAMNFSLQALAKCREELDHVIHAFPQNTVDEAHHLVTAMQRSR